MISRNETIQINFLMHTHGGHDGDGEQERLGEGPPHVPAVDGAVILVITSGVHDKGDQRSQVRVAFVLKPICFIIFKIIVQNNCKHISFATEQKMIVVYKMIKPSSCVIAKPKSATH